MYSKLLSMYHGIAIYLVGEYLDVCVMIKTGYDLSPDPSVHDLALDLRLLLLLLLLRNRLITYAHPGANKSMLIDVYYVRNVLRAAIAPSRCAITKLRRSPDATSSNLVAPQ